MSLPKTIKFTQDLKGIYGAVNLKTANTAFNTFCRTWEQYPGAVDVWKRNFKHVEQLYDYGNAVRKIMYTTNAIESINSYFVKSRKKALSLTKMPYSNYYTYAALNLKVSGMVGIYKIGQWS